MPDRVPYNQRHAHLFSNNLQKDPTVAEPFTRQLASEIPFGRYDKVFYGIDNEELYAQRQSAVDRLANGAAKMAGTFTTSFLEGTVGVINGLAEYNSTGNFSSFYDNAFNRSLDEWNKSLEDKLPNYYTQAEKDSEWWSSTNIFSANFFGDKILKNLGYSFGALAGGAGWGALLKGIGLTSNLVRYGKGLQALEAVETAMVNAPKAQKFGAINQALNSVWNSTKGAVGTAFTNTDRAIISSTGMLGEATIEALQSSNEFRNNLIQDYKNLYGTNPTGEDLEEINSYADNVGKTVLGANAVLLSVSNFLQLPKILGSSKTAEKRMINNIVREGTAPGSKFMAGVPSTGNILSPFVSALGKPGRFIDKYILGPGRLTFSAGEAFEEGAQYAIQFGTQDYFERASKNMEDVESTIDGISGVMGNIVTEGVRRALTDKEGLESILIGGISGALQKGITSVKERGLFGTGGIYGRNTDLAINALNKTKIDDVLKDGIRYTGIAFGSQKLRQQAIQNDDTLNEKDYEKDFELSYILPRVKYGKLDSILQEINYYRQQVMSSPNGFQELRDSGVVLEGETEEKFKERLNSLEETAKNVNKLHSSIEDKYSGMVVDGKPLYSSNAIDKLTYAAAKIADYDGRIPSLNSKLIASGIDNVSEILEDIINDKPESYQAAVDKINSNDKITKTQKIETVRLLDDVAELGIRRDKFLKEYDEILKNPEKFKETLPIEQSPDSEVKEDVKKVVLPTLKGDKEFEVGKEYFLGRRVEESEEGFPIFKYPKFTILGELPDGKVKVRSEDGKIYDLSKSAFKKYTYGSVEATLNNKKAKFFLESIGQQFAFKRKWPNKPDIGWLEWSDAKGQLLFVYKNAKGERIERIVEGKHFVAQGNYKEGLITKVGPMTPKQQQALDELESSTEEDLTVSEKRGIVSETLASLYESSKKNLDEITKKLKSKQEKLSEIQEQLKELTTTKKGQPRKNITKAARKTINELYSLKETIDNEIIRLTEEKDEVQRNVDYFQVFITDMEDAPLDEQAFIEDLKEEIKSLEEIVENSNSAISFGKSLLSSIGSALDTAFKMLAEFTTKLRQQNPTFPASLETLRENIEKFYGEEGLKIFEQQRLGFIQDLLDVEDQIQEYREELKIPDMTNKEQKLLEDMAEIQRELDKLTGELSAKKGLLKELEAAVKRVAEQKAQEERVLKSGSVASELLGTKDLGLQTRAYDLSYEPVPKKSDIAVVLSTKVPSDSDQPHVKRANLFGIRFPNIKNKKKIKAVVLSEKNEADFGMAGLMKHLKEVSDAPEEEKSKIKPEKTVALLMVVETKSGSFIPVDVDGNPIEEPNFDNTIYQTFPDPSLEWSSEYGGGSMFREETAKNKAKLEYYKNEYAKWHSEMLENPTNLPHEVEASFGIPQFPTRLDESGKPVRIYETRTPVADAGLVDEKSFQKVQGLVHIPTTSGVLAKGSTFFDSPLGRPFLSLANAYVKLMNRRLNENEASTIYEAIYQLSKDIFENGNVKSDKSKRLINWLRTIVYWGTPKNETGYNSIFFDKTDEGLKIFFSNKNDSFQFTPQSILDNKNEIIALLGKMYNNINSARTSKDGVWDQPYEEIIGFDESGEPIVREVDGNPYWPNYQTYLLSGKNRKPEEIPLATQMRPLVDENDVNRDGVYFTLTDTADSQRYNNPPKPAAPLTPIPTAAKKSDLETKYDGVKENTVEFKDYGTATFKLDIEKYVETNGDEGFTPMFDKEMVNKIMKDKGKTEAEAKNIIGAGIINKIKEDIDRYKESKKQPAPIVEEEEKEEAPAPTTAYDLTGKKENVIDLSLDENTNISVTFSLDGKRYVDTNGDEGFDITFDKAEIDKLIKYFKEVKGKDIDEDRAKQIIAASVINKMKPYLEQFKEAPTAVSTEAAKTDIERKPVIGETLTSDSGKNYIIKGFSDRGGIQWNNTKDGSRGVWSKEDFYKYIKEGRLKYDAELAAPKEAKPAEAPAVEESSRSITPSEEQMKLIEEQMRNMSSDAPMRRKLENELKMFKPENWNEVEKWLKTKFPNVPVYRVKNIIQATNGDQAWGMFKDGAIYIYENAEVGTVYHEVFHSVWRMFSDPAEQKAVMDEMRQRKGTFVDASTLTNVSYSEATDDQLEEKLAEEFRDYVQFKKIPAKPESGRPYILKLFSDLVTAIKEFFTGKKAKSNTEKLFKKIGTGYYAKYSPYHSSLAFAKKGIIDVEEAYPTYGSAFRIKDIPANQVHEIMQQMTYTTLIDAIRTNKSLFSIPKLRGENKTKLYEKLLYDVQQTVLKKAKAAEALFDKGKLSKTMADAVKAEAFAFWMKVTNDWEQIKKKHEEYLKTYNIEFDENDQLQLNTDERAKESGWMDATKIDAFRKTNSAVKLLISTIPVVDANGEFIYSSINGVKLVPASQAFMSLMNTLHTSRTPDEMMERLRVMAENDPNYRTLYARITKTSYTSDTLDLSNISEIHDGQLISAFWRTFKKQSPDVKNVYVFENGDVEVGDSNFSSAARQVASEYVENFKVVLNSANPYFEYSKERKAYIGKPEGIKDIKEGFKKSKNESELIDRMILFLKSIGIEFKKEEIVKLSGDKREAFKQSVNGIVSSIEKSKSIATISGKVLDFQGRFLGLSTIRAMINNPEFDSTFFNIKGERVQSFIGTNAASDLFDVLSQIENLNELVNTSYEYLLTDEFAQNSVIIQKMFDLETGEKLSGKGEILKPGYVDGTINKSTGKTKESSKLNYKERLIQEMNMNLKGFYYNLVPGDASIEWMLYMTNHISSDSLLSGLAKVNEIFKGYFLSELALSRKNRNIESLDGKRKTTDLRFFKGILDAYEEGLHDDIVKDNRSAEEVYDKYKSKINKALESFINKDVENFKNTLFEYGVVNVNEKMEYSIENVAFEEKENMTEAALNRQLTALSVNYMINNIELHKILYSDPYQYKDELKRIKSFNSPRQAIINGSKNMNAAFNNIYNKDRENNDVGWYNFVRDFFRTATLEDVLSTSDLKDYNIFEETDGGGIINFKAFRNFRIRAGEWTDEEEEQYIYDIAYEKVVKGKNLTNEQRKEKGLLLSAKEKKVYAKGNPKVASAYTPIKPIVSGNKGNGRPYNDVVLDKFSLYPLSFRVAHELNPDSNAVKQYEKMQREDIDYVVFGTGRKVGAEKVNPIYDEKNGSFVESEYEDIINIPYGIISIQSEVPSKDTPLVTRGSQVTKLVTLDYMESGMPIDFEVKDKNGNVIKDFKRRFKEWDKLKTEEAREEASPIYKEMRNNQTLLIETIKEGYNQLLKEMGITQSVSSGGKKSFKITDFEKAAKTLRNEILKREVNDNINDALDGFLKGDAVLEATPAYQQVRNILYSIADKRVISPKISGGQKVQIASTFFEENRLKAEGKKGNVFSSEVLDFYKDEDGKRVCEIMVGRWFNTNMTDEELLKYLNTTDEGQKILQGVAFRIPTQKQNSIDVFRIKKFLPKEFGDSVVVPSALVKKVGSDFDIDKLSIYFKNVLVNAKGEPKIIPFFGYGEQAKKKINEWLVNNELLTLFDVRKEDPDAIEKLTEEDEEKDIAEIDKYYKKSLENEYIESMQKLITHPLNFKRLIAPNSAKQMKDLAKEVTKKLGFESFDYASTTNMLSRRFMSRMRHAFVSGKYAIGIAAVNQTNHSLNQRQLTYVDVDRFDNLNDVDKKWLTAGTGNREDINLKFEKFNRMDVNGRMVAVLSMIENAEGQDISDIIGQFIDGYVDISKGPWIMELGATPNVASTWLFLIKAGVPVNTVAYFMNQPIIREYLRSIQASGYSYLFIGDLVESAKMKYKSSVEISKEELPSEKKLYEMMGNKALNDEQKAQQTFILDEFLKYAKMAEQLFYVTQGSNFDTSTFNDPYLIFKKEMQLEKARKSIISSVDDILENSFIGTLYTSITDFRDGFAEILKSDQPNVRNIVQTVLMDYIDLPDKEFVKVARKVVNDLFDWAVQVDTNLNKRVQDILLNEDGGAAKEMSDFVKSVKEGHPLYKNLVLESLTPIFADAKDSNKPNNLKIKNKDNKVYDQNQMIYAFQELREYLKNKDSALYGKLVRLAILQSGLSNSPISFTSLLPYEDFKSIYNKTISSLETFSKLNDFVKLNVFQRNNWNDDELVPHRIGKQKFNQITLSRYYTELSFGSKAKLNEDMGSGKIPQLIKLYTLSSQAKSDFVVFTWRVGSTKQQNEMRAKGDFSFIKKGLFKKVYRGEGKEEPLLYLDKRGNPQFIYKMVNAWGDSFRANEFYDVARKSVIENGMLKVENEVADSTIVAYFDGSAPSQLSSPKPSAAPLPTTPGAPLSFEQAFSPERQESIINNFIAKHKGTRETALKSIREAISEEGQSAIDMLNKCY